MTAAAATASNLRTLGAFDLRVGGRPVARPSTQKARALIAYLAMRGGASVSREEIIEAFWPDSEVGNARQSLKTALWSIRRSLRAAEVDPDAIIAADYFTVRCVCDIDVDAVAFERLARAGDPKGLQLYAGDFLPGDYDGWAAAERERLIALLESLLSKLLEGSDGVTAAQRLLQIDPFNEPAYATLVQAELHSGRTVAAQTLLTRFRTLLRENGLATSDEFEARFARFESNPLVRHAGPRFVGRARELAFFEQTLRGGDARSILLHGDAGFGKTALVERFSRLAAEAGRPFVLLSAQPKSTGFGGWEQIYAARTGEAFESVLDSRGASVAGALARAIAQTVPPGAFVCVDDAQHLRADALFVTCAVVAAARANGASAIVSARPEGIATAAEILADAALVDMPLAGLTEDDVRAALPQRGGDAERIARALYARTHGHPLFLQSLLARATDGEPALQMPPGVRNLIRARLNERGKDPHAVAALLALDRHFTSSELATMLEWREERALDAIDDLLALGVLRESPDSAYLEFTHDVVMEVARDSLSPQRRRSLHRAAARLLCDASATADVARAAEHQSAAGEALTATRSFLRCSEAAAEIYESRNSAAFAQRARAELLALERTPETARLALDADAAIVDALNRSYDLPAAEREASRALAEADAAGDAHCALQLHLRRMGTRARAGDDEGSALDAEAALRLAQRSDDHPACAEAYLGLANVAMRSSNEPLTERSSASAVEHSIASGDTNLVLFSAGERIHALVVYWRFADAMMAYRNAEALLHGEYAIAEPNFRHNVSQLMYLLDRFEESRSNALRGLDLLERDRRSHSRFRPDRKRTLAILDNMRGLAAAALGDWDEALAAADAFAVNPVAEGNAELQAHVADLTIRALLGRSAPGDLERARALLPLLNAATTSVTQHMYAPIARARVAALAGDPDAPALLDAALTALAAAVTEKPLDGDIICADVLSAARALGASAQIARARELHDVLRARRRDAAGAFWGGFEATAQAERLPGR